MKYWSGSFIYYHDVTEGESRIPNGFPAAEGFSFDTRGQFWGFYEVEIVPNTLRVTEWMNPATFLDERVPCVDVVNRIKKFGMTDWRWHEYPMPISHFGLTDIPDDLATAYKRAMKVI